MSPPSFPIAHVSYRDLHETISALRASRTLRLDDEEAAALAAALAGCARRDMALRASGVVYMCPVKEPRSFSPDAVTNPGTHQRVVDCCDAYVRLCASATSETRHWRSGCIVSVGQAVPSVDLREATETPRLSSCGVTRWIEPMRPGPESLGKGGL